tara:strand:+ start:5621 stop:5842 length:222 start_codon:yes stop_codon:yes gene_type:complete
MTGKDETKSKAMLKRITDGAKELRDQGIKSEPFAVAASGVLIAQLILSQERIERLESDIKSLTDMVADLEAKQ